MAEPMSQASLSGEPPDSQKATEELRAEDVPAGRAARRALVVLGMHRSGTSALARVLGLSGAALPRHLVAPSAGVDSDSNSVAGFWESEPILKLHEEALESAGARWHSPFELPTAWYESDICRTLTDRLAEVLEAEFGDSPIFVVKDPRISLFVPLWKAALRDLGLAAHWLVAVRDPLAVAASLRRRDGFVESKGLLLWLTHFLAAERHTRGEPRLFVRYDELLKSWRDVVAGVEARFGFRFPRRSYFAAAQIDDFVDPGLCHHAPDGRDLEAREEVPSWVRDAFRWAVEAAAGCPPGGEVLDAISRDLHQAELLYAPLAVTSELESRERPEAVAEPASEPQREAEGPEEPAHLLVEEPPSPASAEDLPTPEPAASEPEPTASEPEPTASEPELTAAEPEPTAAEPEPTAAEPEPTAAEPEPTAAEPEPAAESQPPAIEPAATPQAATAAPQAPAAFRVKTLAFYLPQYHPVPENDKWWGRGFTEWTNVTAARPCFDGHAQPLLPADLGFYDLRVSETRERQATLAREHGIHGFCYYYYSFGGRRLLSRPLDEMLATGRPDFPFCLCWANENWTRSWDGQHDHVLIAQEHSAESDARFIDEVLPALLDPRYIRCNGAPVLLVYRADLLADPLRTTDLWRDTARRAGLPDLHLCAVWKVDDPLAIGFDALVEFPPHHFPLRRITGEVAGLVEGFAGEVLDYAAGVAAVEPLPDRGFPVYRGVMPGWDNTPRRGKSAWIFTGSTPELYRQWLEAVARESAARPGTGDQFVFINAWNEWGEGATLEPTHQHARAYLEATGAALHAARDGDTDLERLERRLEARLDLLAEELEALRRGVEEAAAREAPSPREETDPEAAQEILELWRSSLAHGAGSHARELWLSPVWGVLPLLLKLPIWLATFHLPSRLRWWRKGRRILRSGRFDAEDYLQRYPELRHQGFDPLYHFVRCGEAEGREASASGWRINPGHARSRNAERRPILVVSHDAARAGAQLILLEVLRHLAAQQDLELFVLLLKAGELEEDFASVCHTLQLDRMAAETGASPARALDAVLGAFLGREPLLAWCNTVVSSDAAVACHRRGLPVLSLVFELPTTIEATVGKRALLDMVQASRRTIVASRFVRQELVETYDLDPDLLVPVHTGVLGWERSDGWRRRCRATILSELGLPKDTFLVLGCGTVHPRKGTDLFVQVAREAMAMGGRERLFFLWIGPDQDGPLFRRWCNHDLAATGLADRVRLAGGRRSTADYFGAADAFALTSREDPFPMVGLEAMARGVPVVAFGGAGGASEAMGDGAGIVVPYLDVKEMARAVVSLSEAPHYHAQISRAAEHTVNTRYQWSSYLRELLAILEKDFGYLPSSEAAGTPG